jgi:hypothetical protein
MTRNDAIGYKSTFPFPVSTTKFQEQKKRDNHRMQKEMLQEKKGKGL